MPNVEASRAVGSFDVFFAPLNPLGIFDDETFKATVETLLQRGSIFVGIDLTGVEELYSGAFNAILVTLPAFIRAGGEFVMIVDSEKLKTSLSKAGILNYVKIFRSEGDLLKYSITNPPSKKGEEPDAADLVKDIPEVPEEFEQREPNENPPETGSIEVPANIFEDQKPASGLSVTMILLVVVVAIACVLLFLFLL